MPTFSELVELRDNCTPTWITQNGVHGIKLTGPNGNSIFLPKAGYCFDRSFESAGYYGFYWSSTLNEYTSRANALDFDVAGYLYLSYYRYFGYSVRAVMR